MEILWSKPFWTGAAVGVVAVAVAWFFSSVLSTGRYEMYVSRPSDAMPLVFRLNTASGHIDMLVINDGELMPRSAAE